MQRIDFFNIKLTEHTKKSTILKFLNNNANTEQPYIHCITKQTLHNHVYLYIHTIYTTYTVHNTYTVHKLYINYKNVDILQNDKEETSTPEAERIQHTPQKNEIIIIINIAKDKIHSEICMCGCMRVGGGVRNEFKH